MEEGTCSTGPPCHWSSFRPSGDAVDAEMKNFNLGEGGVACYGSHNFGDIEAF